MKEDVLRVAGLRVNYGGLLAVDNASLSVRGSQLVGLIGPNGAGKTTFIDAVTGLIPSAGEVRLDGTRIDDLPPHLRVRRGLGRTFQSIELFDDLTVRENLLVSIESGSFAGAKAMFGSKGTHESELAVKVALDAVGIADLAAARPNDISLGHRKLVTVARALAGRSRMLLLDEPAAGLDSDESLALGEQLRSVTRAGTSILLVDHDMGLVLSVCDYIYVLEFGRVIAQGRPGDIVRDEGVIRAYLGDEEGVAAVEEGR